MISFYPGPSRVDERIPKYVRDACKDGIVSSNHRSEAFMALYRHTVKTLRKKLLIPKEYSIIFLTSATESWEVIAQSMVRESSYHFYNGAFGQKWFDYTKKLKSQAIGYRFDRDLTLKTGELDLSARPGVICLTQNETSNGTQIHNKHIEKLYQKYPDHIIAVDATSSMAGVVLDFASADIWYASVQKCFGLPAGLAVMVCSPKARQWALDYGEKDHYNSFTRLLDMADKFQTTCTPNVLNIYLLMRVMEARADINTIHQVTVERYKSYTALFEKTSLSHLIKNEEVRSYTVLPVEGEREFIQQIKAMAEQNGIILGNGYGELQDTTFRIANFPAIKTSEVNKLKKFLKSFSRP